VSAGRSAVPLADVEAALRDACGITLSEGLRSSLADAVERAARDLQLETADLVKRLRARDHRCLTALVEASVIGETYFFRHPEQFAALRGVLLDAAPRDRPLSIWSAGCATGEEPYSLAMALLDAGRGGCRDRILATDVSERALATARAGDYGPWSLRRLDAGVLGRHFEGVPPRVAVRAAVRAAVEFQRHNLIRDPPPGHDFDLVVCRNVLIYFTPETAAAVAGRLLAAVRPGGWLVLGPVEAPAARGLEAEARDVNGSTLLRRLPPGARRAARRTPPPRARAARPRMAPAPAPALAPLPTLTLTPVPVPTLTPTPVPAPTGLDAALDAARRGDVAGAERLARLAASRDLCPESYLLVSMAAEARGDFPGAVEAVRRALYLEPGLAMAHAALVPLYARLGQDDDAARARRNALQAIEGLPDSAPLRGAEGITAGALRSALDQTRRAAEPAGAVARNDA
jgi:chemotaxis protein methyltransferase CheR